MELKSWVEVWNNLSLHRNSEYTCSGSTIYECVCVCVPVVQLPSYCASGLENSPKAAQEPSTITQPPLQPAVISLHKHEPAAVQGDIRIPVTYSAESSKTLSGIQYQARGQLFPQLLRVSRVCKGLTSMSRGEVRPTIVACQENSHSLGTTSGIVADLDITIRQLS